MLFWGWDRILLCRLHDRWLRPLVVTGCCRLVDRLIHHIACGWNYNASICKHLSYHHLIKVSWLSLGSLLGNLRMSRVWPCPSLRIRNHVFAEEVPLYESIWRSWCHKVLVVYLTTSWWVNSHVIVFSYLFLKCFPDNISVATINLRNPLKQLLVLVEEFWLRAILIVVSHNSLCRLLFLIILLYSIGLIRLSNV